MDKKITEQKENVWTDADTEDELSNPHKLSRFTPRDSVVGRASPVAQKPTPHATLRQLAAIIRKPSSPRRRASSGSPTSEGKVAALPPDVSRTPNTRLPLQLARRDKSNPTTPHAIRALQQRRATPGRDRRKSGRLQRETPRDALRQLSRILAPISQPIQPSPLPAQHQPNKPEEILDADFEDELDLPQPRFSIAIDEGDDDSFQEAPPRLSMPLDDADHTGRSIEIGRRAIIEQPRGRLSRGSFGSIRASDRFGNVSDVGMDESSKFGIDESIVDRVLNVDADADELGDLGGDLDLGGDTEDLRRAMFESSGRQTSRYSDLQQNQNPNTDALSPFILNIANLDPNDSSPLFAPQVHEGLDELDDLQHAEIRSSPAMLEKPTRVIMPRNRVSKPLKMSRHGIAYPSFPMRVTKRIVSTFIKSLGSHQKRLGRATLKTIMEASDQYFEQFSEDLGAFAHHGGRKKIDENDVIAVMKRQRIVSANSTPFSLAHKHLPGELLQDMRMPQPKAKPQRRKPRLEVVHEGESKTDDDE